MAIPQHILDRFRQLAVEEGFTEEQYRKYKKAMNKISQPKKVKASKPIVQVVIGDKNIKARKGTSKNGHSKAHGHNGTSSNLASGLTNPSFNPKLS